MDHELGSYVFFPCFTLVVLFVSNQMGGTRVLLGGLDRDNILPPFILNTFHSGTFCSVLIF
jgi:hypothetical protein